MTDELLPRCFVREFERVRQGRDLWTIASEIDAPPRVVYRMMTEGWYWSILFGGPEDLRVWLAVAEKLGVSALSLAQQNEIQESVRNAPT